MLIQVLRQRERSRSASVAISLRPCSTSHTSRKLRTPLDVVHAVDARTGEGQRVGDRGQGGPPGAPAGMHVIAPRKSLRNTGIRNALFYLYLKVTIGESHLYAPRSDLSPIGYGIHRKTC